MKKENEKVQKTTKTTKTTKTSLPPPPKKVSIEPEIVEVAPTETQIVEEETKAVETKTTKAKKNSTKEKLQKVNLSDTNSVEDFKIKKDLPLWAYWVFVPLIFCMILFIIVFAIGAAVYSG